MKLCHFKEQSYELYIPDEWDYEIDSNITTFANFESGFGALQISSYSLEEEITDIKSLLLEAINDTHEIILSNDEISGTHNHAFYFFVNEEIYWEYHAISTKNIFLLITYNCENMQKGKEISDVKKIIESLKVIV
jgi:hypothetical protein